MNRFEALVVLNMLPEIGSIRLEKMLEFFDTPENILKASEDLLVKACGNKLGSRIHSLKNIDLKKELMVAEKMGLKLITRDDAEYPLNLKNISGAPIVLYVKGRLKKEDELSIAIVGSRRASIYGLSAADKFAYGLSEKGVTIVSGLARGIDTYAHRGALKQGGRTIAVIGSGFRNLYPEENLRLSEEIAQNGAVISEFPLDTQPLPQNFPRRNRVISGLSQGVLVVEAGRNSGALITADFALEQGREVFCLPGEIDSVTSFGTNTLIKEGAKLVTGLEDILEELVSTGCVNKQNEKILTAQGLGEEEGRVYGLLTQEALQIDELAEKTNMDIPRISGILLQLRFKKLVKELPGRQYIRNMS
jgi:DNA processing protein